MNMIMKATDAACRWLMQRLPARRYYIMTGACSEKRSGGVGAGRGQGEDGRRRGCRPGSTCCAPTCGSRPHDMLDMWTRTLVGQIAANVVGYNGHLANGLTALFIACGQDVANVANAAAGMTASTARPRAIST